VDAKYCNACYSVVIQNYVENSLYKGIIMYKKLLIVCAIFSLSLQAQEIPRYPKREARRELMEDIKNGLSSIKEGITVCMHCVTGGINRRMLIIRSTSRLLASATYPFVPNSHHQIA